MKKTTKPDYLKTKIFLDSGDPEDTKKTLDSLGFLDGQTTNPSLIAKNPDALAKIKSGEKFSRDEIYEFYRKVLSDINEIIPNGSLSVEVYVDKDTSLEEILSQARQMNKWVPHAHIKIPITKIGLEAGEILANEGAHLNFTLCFSQSQAAAVHSATKDASPEQIYISPFVGRLDDQGLRGMDLVMNIQRMYREASSHVQVLAASIRTVEHIRETVSNEIDILTAKRETLEAWAKDGFSKEGMSESDLKPIEFQEFDPHQDYRNFELDHELTEKGLEMFAEDWNSLLKR